jgi:UDP-N-acetylglucosamine 2-epimerase (non-hydrolysing)
VALIDIIAGARPNLMKIAPIMRQRQGSLLNFRLVHTGQHLERLLVASAK